MRPQMVKPAPRAVRALPARAELPAREAAQPVEAVARRALVAALAAAVAQRMQAPMPQRALTLPEPSPTATKTRQRRLLEYPTVTK
jgi:hypothetical protein